MLRVLIADDHAVVRQGLRQIVGEISDSVMIEEAASGEEALEKARTHDWEVVILDIAMPGRSGFDILKELKHERPGLPVLVLSMHSEDQFAVRILKAGASGYLTKESAPEELARAVRKVLEGGKYFSPSLAEKLALGMVSESNGLPHENLSDREFQVLHLIASGKSVKDIAAELLLSAKTVSTYRSRVLKKMNMKTNIELLHYAMQHRLIE